MTTINYSNMTKEEIIAHLTNVEKQNEQLRQDKGDGRKMSIIRLIDKGYNTIEEIADELDITNRNVSSYLTGIRKELKSNNEWIISSKIGSKTWIAKVKLDELGWSV